MVIYYSGEYVTVRISPENPLFSVTSTLYNTIHFRVPGEAFLSVLLIVVWEKIQMIHSRRLQATLGHLWFMHSLFFRYVPLLMTAFLWQPPLTYFSSLHNLFSPWWRRTILKIQGWRSFRKNLFLKVILFVNLSKYMVKADLIKTAIQPYRDHLALKSPKMLHGRLCKAAVCSKLMCGMISFLQS